MPYRRARLPRREPIGAGLRTRIERFLERAGIEIAGVEIAGVEFVTGRDGRPLVYDVNTNMNYNADAEAAADLKQTGMQAIAVPERRTGPPHARGRLTRGQVAAPLTDN